jgi:hypothetical protein
MADEEIFLAGVRQFAQGANESADHTLRAAGLGTRREFAIDEDSQRGVHRHSASIKSRPSGKFSARRKPARS